VERFAVWARISTGVLPLTAYRLPLTGKEEPWPACHLLQPSASPKSRIIEIVSALALIGWLNRWTCALAPALEPDALAFAQKHLAPSGWTPGMHAARE
jgi:hypothetical protein